MSQTADTYSFDHFATYCTKRHAQGEREFRAIIDQYIAEYPGLAQPLRADFIANTEQFVLLGQRLAPRRMATRILDKAFAAMERPDHHLDAPRPRWQETIAAALEDPKDHAR